MPQSYKLHIISVSGIQWKPQLLSFHREKPNLSVEISVDGKKVYHTSAKRDWSGMWNDISSLSVDTESAKIGFQVFHKSALKPRQCLAKIEREIGVLLKECSVKGDFQLKLDHADENLTQASKPELVVCMSPAKGLADAAGPLAKATENSATLHTGSAGTMVVDLVNQGAQHDDLLSALGTLVARLGNVVDIGVKIGGEIAKIHPYSDAAWKILTSVHEAVKKQKEADEKTVQLVQAMTDVFLFAEDVEKLSETLKCPRLEASISALVKLTEECAKFIEGYCKTTFWTRVTTEIWKQRSQKIDDFCTAFSKFHQDLDKGVQLHTAFVTTDLKQSDLLKTLNHIDMDATDRKLCLWGTRKDLLSLITNWVATPSNSKNSGNILWLQGVAGAGKSTIATSVSEYFQKQKCLGAFLFFSRTDSERSQPKDVLRTIAYKLAESNSDLADVICAAISADRALVNAPMLTQFKELLLEPLKKAETKIPGQIIVILDALDECGDANSRRDLVTLISKEFPNLPSKFRFFITSRPDSDIATKFEGQSKIFKHLLDITLPSSIEDIRLYVDHQLEDIRSVHSLSNVDPPWPGEPKTRDLVACSSGLFIWASTALNLLSNARDPDTMVDTLLLKGLTGIDALYAKALQITGLWDNTLPEEDTQSFIRDVQAALSAVVLGKVPMSDANIDTLLSLKSGRSQYIFSKLGSVLHRAPDQTARVLHTSFADYLKDPTRSGTKPWHIQPIYLARGCLQVLNGPGLRFNICQLKDSHSCNLDVPNISELITTWIPPTLSYASLFWASHLECTNSNNDILEDVQNFLYKKFPFWLEVLSLLQKTEIAIDALTAVGKFSKNCDQDLADFSIDAVKFVIAFAPAIMHSVPQIYLSALPLAPSKSRVRKQFSKWFAHTVAIVSSLGDQWPRLQLTLEGHSRAVSSVSFSSDGERVVSGSRDSTIRVWDARTGTLVAGPFMGHNSEIYCIAFSPNEEHIVYGSDDATLHVLDAQTGIAIAGPFKGHGALIMSVSFSPDGRYIVSGSKDHTARIWDTLADLHTPMAIAKHHSPVNSVAFSPQGDRIVSGASDRTVQVWDARSGAPKTEPFEGHEGQVRSVAFSPNGAHIVSGSADNTICVWDANTGNIIAGPFMGHSCPVNSVVYSLNGEHIISASDDLTVRIWDAHTGNPIASPFEGHSASVCSVAISPDGARIVSGSLDHTVRIWDAHLEARHGSECTADASHTGHSDGVRCVMFSQNGTQILSGSNDKTVRVWDSRTGVLIARPFTGHTDQVCAVAFSLAGEHIISGSRDRTVLVWDALTGDLVAGPFQYKNPVHSIGFSLDGKHIVACSDTGMIQVRNAQTGDLCGGPFVERGIMLNEDIDKVKEDDEEYDSSDSEDDEEYGSSDSDEEYYPSESDEEYDSSDSEDEEEEYQFSFISSSHPEHILTKSKDDTIGLWNAQTGALVFRLFEGPAGKLCSAASSPNGDRIASGTPSNPVVRVWNAQTATESLRLLQGHRRKVYSLAFSRDGRWIASGSHDKTVRVWDAQTGNCIAGPFEGHSAPVLSVAFSPDGERVVSGSTDNTIRVFEINRDRTPDRAFGDGSNLEYGWIVNSLNSVSELILWIPPWLRKSLCFPQNSLIISREGATKLDFSQFVHGTGWEECVDRKFRG